MEWFWLIVAAGASGVGARSWRTRHVLQRARAADFALARRLADEDVTVLSGQLQRLEPEVRRRGQDETVRAAYDAAVRAHESARRAASRMSTADELRLVTEAVATGRTTLAALEARLAGHTAFERRLMCFFDPRHGPSATDAVWSRPGHGERWVPACAQDAQRLADGLPPAIRVVQVGGRTTPYWSAGAAFRPYARGYFGRTPTLVWALEPEAPDAAAGSGGPGHFGTGIVGSSGHFDGGGFDGSGAPG